MAENSYRITLPAWFTDDVVAMTDGQIAGFIRQEAELMQLKREADQHAWEERERYQEYLAALPWWRRWKVRLGFAR